VIEERFNGYFMEKQAKQKITKAIKYKCKLPTCKIFGMPKEDEWNINYKNKEYIFHQINHYL
jgi:hypothetical protein